MKFWKRRSSALVTESTQWLVSGGRGQGVELGVREFGGKWECSTFWFPWQSHGSTHCQQPFTLTFGIVVFFVQKLSSVEEQQEECSSEPALPQAHQAARPGHHTSHAILIWNIIHSIPLSLALFSWRQVCLGLKRYHFVFLQQRKAKLKCLPGPIGHPQAPYWIESTVKDSG